MELITGASRGELLEWINSTLHMNLTKIEETASGRKAEIQFIARSCCLSNDRYAVSWYDED